MVDITGAEDALTSTVRQVMTLRNQPGRVAIATLSVSDTLRVAFLVVPFKPLERYLQAP
jgi:hypothetical protein